ncbi:MAG: HpcH/HpaI aldolase family protein [bacterium]
MSTVKHKLREGEPVFHCQVLMHHPMVVERLGYAGFDVVCLDAEHAPLDGETCVHLVRAAECVGVTPIFRSTLNHEDEVLPMLDTGLMGIMVPHVNTKRRAQMAVRAVKYAPVGSRGMTPGRASRYGAAGISTQEYIENSNRETLVLVQIEEIDAVKNLEDILSVDNVDVYVLGTGDLAQSMGFPGERQHPEVLAVVDEVIDRVTSAGRVVGMPAGGHSIDEWLDRGVRYLIWGDGGLLMSAARKAINK